MNEKLIVKDLEVEFNTIRGIAKILRGVSFSLEKHETLGFAGESGCGKTMTALAIMKLIPHPGKIVAGKIIFNNEDLTNKTTKEILRIRGKNISLVFQEPLTSLNPCFRIRWQLEEVLALHYPNLNKKEREERIIEILKNVGLSDIKKVLYSFPHQLSGGMRQRIIIAMAIICNPEIIIADEPTTALDVTIQAEILSLIKQIQEERKQLSLIFISHDINLLSERCDRIMIMYMGEIVEIARSEELINNPLHPYSIGLIGSTPRISSTRRKFNYIKGDLPDPYTDLIGCAYYSRCMVRDKMCSIRRPELTNIDKEHSVRCFKRSI